MKAYVKCYEKGVYRTEVNHGNQYFTIYPLRSTEEEAKWMADMFMIALRKHNAEKRKQWQKQNKNKKTSFTSSVKSS